MADAPRRRTATPHGFTLAELLIITVIIGVLSLIGATAFGGFRERAMVAAAQRELRNATQAIEVYRVTSIGWPAALDELAVTGFRPSLDIRFCRYELVTAADPAETHIALEAMHRAARTSVETMHPIWGGTMEEKPMTLAECTGAENPGGGQGKGKGKGKGKEQGKAKGQGQGIPF